MSFDIGGAIKGGLGGFLGSGGNPIGALAGGVMGGFMSGPSAPQIPAFKPFDISGPLGETRMQQGRMIGTLSPELQGVQQGIGGILGMGTGLTGNQMLLANMARAGGAGMLGIGNQLGGLAGQIPGFQSQLGTVGQGMLGFDPALAGMQGAFTGAGMGALGAGMSQLGSPLDPDAIASEQMQRMQALLAPRRERTRLGLESRLARQGLLGSTAGGEQFRALGEAENMQDIGLAERALGQGLQTQQQGFQQGMGLAGLGRGLLGAGAGVLGQRTGLLGGVGDLISRQAGLTGAQASLLGQQAGMIPQATSLFGMPASLEQQAQQRFLGAGGSMQNLLGSLQGQMGLGTNMGAQQQQVNLAQANMQNQANLNQADMQNALLMGGLNSAMGSGFDFSGLFNPSGTSMSTPTGTDPMFMMQNPFGAGTASQLGLGFNPMQGVQF